MNGPDGTPLVHRMPFGAELHRNGTRFRLWAPSQERIELVIEGQREPVGMSRLQDGWHEVVVGTARAGTRYRFRLENGMLVPDPASRFQPEDVHGPSEVVDPALFKWRHTSWPGLPWHETVLYELHVGAFSEAGSFDGIIDRLDHLAKLGITAIELMPVADFPGGRNWGYDGVLPFAPDSNYGTPDGLKALVDAAHGMSLMVILDVVYNHFGPDGNFLPLYAPQFFTERHRTPWGAAVNYDGEQSGPVREFVINNTLFWLKEYNLDGLRLDAVHAIMDDSPKHLLKEIGERVSAEFGEKRHVHLILENEENEASWLQGTERSAYQAQWNDDVHHCLHTAATGERSGYYAEYEGDTQKLARSLAEGFAFQGELMNYRGEPRGEPSAHLPPTAFISFIQNHDQVGNRAFGDRITDPISQAKARAIACIYLLAPQIPMLFMGEEWATTDPFPFFCDFKEPLAEAVRTGRRAEFKRFPEFQDEQARQRIPDPTAQSTFESAKLSWDLLRQPANADWLQWYRTILSVRRSQIVPIIPECGPAHYEVLGRGEVIVSWPLQQALLLLHANLADAAGHELRRTAARVVWHEGTENSDHRQGPWSVTWLMAPKDTAA
jgi:malto-oligosyltrehalose trehalohydrolase